MAKSLKGSDILADGSESIFDLFCQPCSEDNKHLEARGYCMDCEEYLCTDCYDSHRRPRPSRHHVLVQKDQMPKHTQNIKPKTLTDPCTIPCDKHPHQLIEYRCQNHDVVVCSVCVTLAHTTCAKEYIPDITKTAKDDHVLKRVRARINEMTNQVDTINEKAKQNLKSIQDIYSDAVEELRKLRKEINERIDELERTIVIEADSLKTADTDTFQSILQACANIQCELDVFKKQLHSLKKSNQENDLFVRTHTINKRLKELQEDIQNFDKKDNVIHYTFERTDKVSDFVKNIDAYGKLCRKERLVARHLHDLSVEMKQDKCTPTITGSVILPGQVLVLVDAFNQTLKVLNLESYTWSTFAIPGNPWDVTETGRNTIALTLPDQAMLLCVRIRETIEQEREIKTSGRCIGVAFRNARFFIALHSPPRLEILNEEGELLHMSRYSNSMQGQFVNPQYVITNGDDILVSDGRTDTVTIFAGNGSLKAKYKSADLASSLDMAADGKGSIFVCGCRSNNIHVISEAGDFKHILLSSEDGVKGPQSVVYCETAGQLFVSQEYDKNIHVYQITKE